MNSLYKFFIFKVLDRCTRGSLTIKYKGRESKFGEQDNLKNPEAIIEVHDPFFFKSIFLYGEIGMGESFTNHYWSSPNLLEVFYWFLLNYDFLPNFSNSSYKLWAFNVLGIIDRIIEGKKAQNDFNQAKENIKFHYDIGNDLFQLILDKTMAYSSGVFRNESDSLEQAQINKFDKLAKNLKLTSNDYLLEIGSGWGGFSVYVAKKYGCRIKTITISNEQFAFVKELIKKEKLEDLLEIELADYRQLKGQFDKIVSIEMIEAIGFPQLDIFAQKCTHLLKPAGILAIQMITFNDHQYFRYVKKTNWLSKHIFPGSHLISMVEFLNAFRRCGELTITKSESIASSYAKTLDIWQSNFENNLDQVRKIGFDDNFIRKWNYYLISCRAAFELKYIDNLQVTLVNKKGITQDEYSKLNGHSQSHPTTQTTTTPTTTNYIRRGKR